MADCLKALENYELECGLQALIGMQSPDAFQQRSQVFAVDEQYMGKQEPNNENTSLIIRIRRRTARTGVFVELRKKGVLVAGGGFSVWGFPQP